MQRCRPFFFVWRLSVVAQVSGSALLALALDAASGVEADLAVIALAVAVEVAGLAVMLGAPVGLAQAAFRVAAAHAAGYPLADNRRAALAAGHLVAAAIVSDRKSTRLNSSHSQISYAVFCLKK